MSTIVRSHLLSTYRVARRLVNHHAQTAYMGMCRKNAACWRILNCNVRLAHSITQSTWIDKESQEMMTVWPDVVRDITDAVKSLNIPEVPEWIVKLLDYNVPRGKKIRSLTLIHAYKLLIPNDQLTEENIHLVHILAWSMELVQAYILIMDDIMDQSLVRRGQPCWYLYNDIDQAANNDAVMLKHFAFYLIRKYFKGKDCYVDLMETFQDISLKTIIGQCLDLLSTNFGKKPNLDLFTMNRFNSIAKYKTGYYTFIFPVFAAMNLAGIKNPEIFRQAKTILLEMGNLYQAQNDYWACFEDLEVGGKDDNDIQEGKCTWFVVKALERATPEQCKILKDYYGVKDLEKAKCVRQLFVDLNLMEDYLIYEKETYNALNDRIQQMSCGLPHKLFWDILELLYRKVSSKYNLDWKNKQIH